MRRPTRAKPNTRPSRHATVVPKAWSGRSGRSELSCLVHRQERDCDRLWWFWVSGFYGHLAPTSSIQQVVLVFLQDCFLIILLGMSGWTRKEYDQKCIGKDSAAPESSAVSILVEKKGKRMKKAHSVTMSDPFGRPGSRTSICGTERFLAQRPIRRPFFRTW